MSQLSVRAVLRAARSVCPAVTLLIAAVASPIPAAAHGELVVQLGAERIQPGGTLEIRGDLGTGEAFEVALISKADGSRRLVATIPAVDEGHFASFVTVPADLAPGDYLLEVAVDLTVARAPLTLAGAPIVPGADPPVQEDGLVHPLPSGFGQASSARASQPAAAPVSLSDSDRASRSAIDGVAAIALAGVLAAAIVIGLRLVGRTRHSAVP